MNAPHCTATTAQGQPCRQAAASGYLLCCQHLGVHASTTGTSVPPRPSGSERLALTANAPRAVPATVAAPDGPGPTDDDNLALFRRGQEHTPLLAAQKGRVITQLTLPASCATAPGPSLAMDGLAIATRRRHLAMLRSIKDTLAETVPGAAELPIDVACVEWVTRRRIARKWSWSTTSTNMGCLAGALASLLLYCSEQPVLLTHSPTWRDAGIAAQRRAREADISQALPATKEQVQQAVTATQRSDPSLAVLIALSWATAARIGCALQLKAQDVELSPNGNLVVTFRRGKSVRLRRQPYSIHSHLGQWTSLVQQYLALRPPGSFLWPASSPRDRLRKGQDLRDALRTLDPRLGQRSMRRGALQSAAALGTDEATLLHFSGHATPQMLRRYLGWGRQSRAVTATAHPVGLALCA